MDDRAVMVVTPLRGSGGSGACSASSASRRSRWLLDAGASRGQPRLRGAEASRIDVHRAHRPIFCVGHEPRGLEHLHVLDDGGQRHGEWLRQLAHRCRTVTEPFDDSTASGIGERLERVVEHAPQHGWPRPQQSSHCLSIERGFSVGSASRQAVSRSVGAGRIRSLRPRSRDPFTQGGNSELVDGHDRRGGGISA